MASLQDHSSLTLVKGLYLGNPGSGKTGSLDSLVGAGYSLYIYDFDNLLGSLVQMVKRNNPDKLSSIKFQTFTDEIKAPEILATMHGNQMKLQPFAKGTPTAYARAMKQLSGWKTTEDGDLGDPARFGPKSIVVIDSLTNAANAAFRYCEAFNPGAKEGQTHYFNAQKLILNLISLLFSAQFETNVLVLAHIVQERNDQGSVIKGWPRSVGSALNDQLGAYFNCILMADNIGSRRVIRTTSTGLVDLKNPVSFSVPDQLPLESGLATFFQAVTS
jgi:hypothetical protein